MRLGEILDVIDAKRPNAFDEDIKIAFINSCILQYGNIIGKSAIYEFETVEGVLEYPLPEGEEGDGIKAVWADEKLCECVDFYEKASEGKYFILPAGFIKINAPAGTKIKIIYNACKPFGYFDGEDYRKADCGVYDSYSGVLIYGALYQIAECEEDLEAASNFKKQMYEILKAARQSKYLKKGKYPAVRKAWGKWNRF